MITNNSETLSRFSFMKMSDKIVFVHPIFKSTSIKNRLTSIAVDSGAKQLSGGIVDVLFCRNIQNTTREHKIKLNYILMH